MSETNVKAVEPTRGRHGRWYVAYGAVWTTPNGPEDYGICLLKADRDEPCTAPTERDANVRLAAAAPELLEAHDPELLEAIADELQGFKESALAHSLRVLARKARAAVAKATGGAK